MRVIYPGIPRDWPLTVRDCEHAIRICDAVYEAAFAVLWEAAKAPRSTEDVEILLNDHIVCSREHIRAVEEWEALQAILEIKEVEALREMGMVIDIPQSKRN